MDGRLPSAALPGAFATASQVQRMLRAAARLWAAARLPGEEFDAALNDARETYRAETIRTQRSGDHA